MKDDAMKSVFVDAAPSEHFDPEPRTLADAFENSREYFDTIITKNAHRLALLRCTRVAELTGESFSVVTNRHADEMAKQIAGELSIAVERQLFGVIRSTVETAVDNAATMIRGK